MTTAEKVAHAAKQSLGILLRPTAEEREALNLVLQTCVEGGMAAGTAYRKVLELKGEKK
jgi:hypothetical protein|nr:MAG: hypothetical protein [Bacteriophage sp.]